MGKGELSGTVDVDVKWYSYYGKTIWQLSKNFKLNYHKVQEFYTCVSKGIEINISKRYLHTPMFIAALFTIVKISKQPKCPLMDE